MSDEEAKSQTASKWPFPFKMSPIYLEVLCESILKLSSGNQARKALISSADWDNSLFKTGYDVASHKKSTKNMNIVKK